MSLDVDSDRDAPGDRSSGGTDDSPTVTGDTAGVAPPVLAVENLAKVYGSGEDAVRAVDDVSFTVDRGTAVGVLGPNGAGKTTTIKSLLGLIVPTAGRVRISGIDVAGDPSAAYRKIGAMLEGARNTYWRLTVRENLRFFAALSGQKPSAVRERHDQLLEQFDLTEKADTPVRELSRGMKQKVSLASTLARDAEVVFLDEPTLGLDVESSLELRRELRRLVEEEGLTALLSSHDMDVIEDVCDRVVVMSQSEIIADDTVDALLDLFHTQAYEVTVDGGVPPAVRERLTVTYDASGFDRHGDRGRFEVSVTGDEFYDLVDDLRDAELVVHEFDAVDPDLEEVFIRLTREEAAAVHGDGGRDE